MSSYFDTMAVCASDPWAVAQLVCRQYLAHLRERQREVLKADAERLQEFVTHAEKIASREVPGPDSRGERAYWAGDVIQDMHTLAHAIGNAKIRLRGGRRLLDNPSGFRY